MTGPLAQAMQLKASHFKERADNLRSFAARDDNPETRKALLLVAQAYDRLAEQHAGSGDPG
jgi:hypothetical protein